MIRYEVNGPADDAKLNALFQAAWPHFSPVDFGPLLEASLLHVIAYDESDEPVGFVRVVPCGLTRGFVLGPTVNPSARGQGVGKRLLDESAKVAQDIGMKMLLVEFASELRGFYMSAGFRHAAAGIRKLR